MAIGSLGDAEVWLIKLSLPLKDAGALCVLAGKATLEPCWLSMLVQSDLHGLFLKGIHWTYDRSMR